MVIFEYCRFGNLKDVLEKHHKNVRNQNSDSNTVQMVSSRAPGHATAVSVTAKSLASWSYQVAQGMQFLAAHRIVHGNLSARAILLSDGNLVKISDFALARAMHKVDVFISEKEVHWNSLLFLFNSEKQFYHFFLWITEIYQGKLEYKWLAIESMQHKQLTTKSDVYSFGILLWELFSFGDQPFEEIETYQLKRHIMNGHTLGKPPYANDNVYDINLYYRA